MSSSVIWTLSIRCDDLQFVGISHLFLARCMNASVTCCLFDDTNLKILGLHASYEAPHYEFFFRLWLVR